MKSRPTKISSVGDACFRTRFQISIVNNVEPELNVAVREDISAANMTARSKPLRPLGKIRITRVGYAIFVHPTSLEVNSYYILLCLIVINQKTITG